MEEIKNEVVTPSEATEAADNQSEKLTEAAEPEKEPKPEPKPEPKAEPTAPATETEVKADPEPSVPEPEAPSAPKFEEPVASDEKAEPETAAEDIEAVKAENYALKHGVKAEYAADAVTLARSRVKDGLTLEQAIEKVCEEYPHFKGGVIPHITTSARTTNDDVSEADDAVINNIMGIK